MCSLLNVAQRGQNSWDVLRHLRTKHIPPGGKAAPRSRAARGSSRPAAPNILQGAPKARWQTGICFASPFVFRKGNRNWPASPISGLLNQKPVWSSQAGAAALTPGQPQCSPAAAPPLPTCPHLKHAIWTQAEARAEFYTNASGNFIQGSPPICKQHSTQPDRPKTQGVAIINLESDWKHKKSMLWK